MRFWPRSSSSSFDRLAPTQETTRVSSSQVQPLGQKVRASAVPRAKRPTRTSRWRTPMTVKLRRDVCNNKRRSLINYGR
ncbi:hypothetical protein DBV15_03064 [Temnothorax longispinosus]|uniref:Uncharacterized protein n=1 Tax=Temnothorax longispinosus TaxID=300112 RepID=A0A4S2KIF0_9HYME|nr:hypothetical protein DBV15_03064 [Temnothorax longispinosus]